MPLPITGLYAGLFAILVIVLSSLVTANRVRAKVSINGGNDEGLQVAIRRHGNLIENIPMALILLGLCEAQQLDAVWLHIYGIVLLIARIIHPLGIATSGPTPLRGLGVLATQIPMLAAAIYLIVSFVF